MRKLRRVNAAPSAATIRERLGAKGSNACCPAHEDKQASLSINENSAGKVLLKCHAGCSQHAVIEAMQERGIWPKPDGGLTVAQLAAAKQLPETLLRESGFADDEVKGRPVVRMDYRDAAGNVSCVRYRGALGANGDGPRFWFRKGDKQQLFGLWRLRAAEPVILVEGETDSIALWAAGFNALGVPGADAWHDSRFADAIPQCPVVYVHIEPDAGGAKFRSSFERSRLRAKVKFFSVAPAAKDPCELRARDADGFRPAIEAAQAKAQGSNHNEAPVTDEPAEWPDPVNILGEMAAPEFTGDEVPEVLSAFALAYARSTGFDPSLTLSAAVSVAAAALTDGFQIVGDSRSQWFQQPRLWILGIGRPGTGKTPVQKAMLSPLWAIQKAMIEEHEHTVATLPEGEDAPPIPRVIIGDATIEALSERLRGNPRGILIANDEFESWLGSHDTYRSGAVSRDRGEWLRLFDGGPHTIERIQRGSVFVENWGASILTATTPAALAKLTRSLPEDGLLQRFIPIIARRKGEAQTVATLDDARMYYARTIERLFAACPRAHKGCVPLSIDAQEFLQAWLKQNQLAQEAFGAMEPALEAHLAKYPSFILRLALTFHAANIVNQEHEQARDPAAFPVSLATLQTAARFLKRATLHAVAIYLDRKSGSDVYELARDVARAILARAWIQVARRDLIQGVRAFRKASDQLQDSVLRLFVDLAWLRYAEGGYQKATPARYDVNPGLGAKFAAVAQRERERRAVIREVIAQTVQDARHADE
jgi:Protein of unknown function (DUF3987)